MRCVATVGPPRCRARRPFCCESKAPATYVPGGFASGFRSLRDLPKGPSRWRGATPTILECVACLCAGRGAAREAAEQPLDRLQLPTLVIADKSWLPWLPPDPLALLLNGGDQRPTPGGAAAGRTNRDRRRRLSPARVISLPSRQSAGVGVCGDVREARAASLPGRSGGDLVL